MRKRIIFALLVTTVLTTLLVGCGVNNETVTSTQEVASESADKESVAEVSNKDKALALINSFTSGDTAVADKYLADSYIQHNLAYGTGKASFISAVEGLTDSGKTTTVTNVRVFEEGDYVFLQTVYNFAEAGEQVAFDVFRFEDGLIAEHWDNLTSVTEANPSGHTQIDGVTEITDTDKTDENKDLVAGFINDVLVGENPDALTSYIDGDNYIQHNSDIADGLTGLGEALASMAENGIEMVYNETHMILGEGNFVLGVSEGTFGGEQVAYYDLFRVENGKIVEHWDVIETIPDVSEWQNENGKFDATTDMNKAKAVAVLTSLASGDEQPITDYVSEENYVQHNLAFADGRQTLLDALAPLKDAGTTAEVVRVIAEGDYVGVQMHYNLFGAGEQAGFDIFRFEDGKIVEHWDNLQSIAEANPSGHTQFDGLFHVTDKDKTAENKELVENFVKDILVGENPDNLQSYFNGDNYIQHNTGIADGLTGLGEALSAYAEAGIEMIYTDVKITIAQGNYVLVASQGTLGGVDTAFYDLFRVENGKIAEHWDIIETIADEADWANTNGKF